MPTLRRALVSRLLAVWMGCWLAGSMVGAVAGQAPASQADVAEASDVVMQADAAVDRWNPAEMRAFADGVVASLRRIHDVPGAVLTVVTRDQVLLNVGYGQADLETGQPVDPQTTLFRVGSVSKLLTWIAVMQQVEAGRIDLEGDVNQWLGETQIPEGWGAPINLGHIMSHTAGFEDHVIGLFAREPADLSLSELLSEQMPERVRAPGTFGSYSNHATAMAALAVQNVSGSDYHDYVEQKILNPLGMTAATTRQPLPAELEASMASGYMGKGVAQRKSSFEYVPLAAAGSTSASGAAMAKFMQALLGEGRERILSESSWKRMQEPLNPMDDRLSQMLHGFYQQNRLGVNALGHGGDTMAFHTVLKLYPELGVGMFISTNSDGGAVLRSSLARAFEDRFFRAETNVTFEPAALEQLQLYAGWYRPIRFPHTSLAKLIAILGSAPVGIDPAGYLTFPDQEMQGLRRLARLDNGLFADADGNRYAFREEDGSVTHLFVDGAPMVALERISFLQSPPVQFGIPGVAAVLLAIAALSWGIRALRGGSVPGGPLVVCGVTLGPLLLVVFMLSFIVVLSDANEIAFRVPPALMVLLALPLLAIPSVAFSAYMTWKVWAEPRRSRWMLLMSTGSGVVFLVWLMQWNLLGYHTG